jgi:hypothetical protein
MLKSKCINMNGTTHQNLLTSGIHMRAKKKKKNPPTALKSQINWIRMKMLGRERDNLHKPMMVDAGCAPQVSGFRRSVVEAAGGREAIGSPTSPLASLADPILHRKPPSVTTAANTRTQSEWGMKRTEETRRP